MALNLGTYSPGTVNVIINSRTLVGLDDGEFVRTERTNESEFTTRVGALGDFTFQENLDKSGLIIIRMKQLSPDNTFLTSLLEGRTVFASEIRSAQSHLELVTAQICMISVQPRKVFGQEETVREWTIACGELIETAKAL